MYAGSVSQLTLLLCGSAESTEATNVRWVRCLPVKSAELLTNSLVLVAGCAVQSACPTMFASSQGWYCNGNNYLRKIFTGVVPPLVLTFWQGIVVPRWFYYWCQVPHAVLPKRSAACACSAGGLHACGSRPFQPSLLGSVQRPPCFSLSTPLSCACLGACSCSPQPPKMAIA